MICASHTERPKIRQGHMAGKNSLRRRRYSAFRLKGLSFDRIFYFSLERKPFYKDQGITGVCTTTLRLPTYVTGQRLDVSPSSVSLDFV